MRSLTASEKRLGFLFVALVFAAVNFFGIRSAGEKLKGMELRLLEAANTRREQEAWLGQGAEWKLRREWLDAKQPLLTNPGQEGASLQQALSQSAQKYKLTIKEQELLDTADTPSYREVAMRMQVEGTLEAVLRWLADLQGPERFLVVRILNLKSHAEVPKVICNVRVAKWFAPEGSSPVPSPQGVPEESVQGVPE